MSLPRLLAQLAVLADREQGAIFDQYAWPPRKFSDLPEADREQHAYLGALGDSAWKHAESLGWDGCPADAFD